MMTRPDFLTVFAAAFATFSVAVTVLFWPATGADELAAPGGPSLRDLAEIDGNPATFTDAEKRKFAVLAQVLGISPSAENSPDPPTPVHFGS